MCHVIIWPRVYAQILRRTDPFGDLVRQGYIRAVEHPRWPLTLYEYTAKAQFDGLWDPVLRVARGLIVEHLPGRAQTLRRIVANPFPRFANLNEIEETKLEKLPKELYISEKLDGSLVIVWHYEGSWQFSTRGSFTSPQAQAAQRWYRQHATGDPPDPSCTYLFEWISPDNRIVVDYGDRRELVLLAVRKNATGEEEPPERLPIIARQMGVPYVRIHPMSDSVDDILFGPPDEDEGRVLYSHRPYLRVKVKSPEYVRLHRLVTQLRSPATLLAWVRSGEWDAVVSYLPDGIRQELEAQVRSINERYHDCMQQAQAWVERTSHLMSRKEKALACRESPREVQAVFFALLDGKPEEASRRAWAYVERSLQA